MIIENLPYGEFIARYDGAETLFYLDPPYHGAAKPVRELIITPPGLSKPSDWASLERGSPRSSTEREARKAGLID